MNCTPRESVSNSSTLSSPSVTLRQIAASATGTSALLRTSGISKVIGPPRRLGQMRSK